MATSGSTNWSINRDTAITAALRKLGVLYEGQSASANQITTGAEALNSMLKAFQTDGMPLWAIKEHTFTVTSGTRTYLIGESQTLNTPMPLKVIQAYRTESGGVNTPMNIYNHYDYNLLPLTPSSNSGTPITLFYQPFSTYGQISLWPIPDDSTTTVTIVYQRPFEDMDSASNDFDFPSYWMDAVVFGLAWRLAPEYGTPKLERDQLKEDAKFFRDEALSFGTEEGSFFIMPNWEGQGR